MINSDKLRILVVTNSNFLNDTFSKFLTNKIIEVCCCSDGLKCIKYAAESSPSLIFIDTNLSGFSCLDTVKVLNSLNLLKTVPTAVMLSYSQSSMLAGLVDFGISTMLYKPFNRNEVLTVVNDLIGEKIRRKTESLPVMDAVIVNAVLNKPGTNAKVEQLNKIKSLKTFLQNINSFKSELLTSQKNMSNEGTIKVLKNLKEYGNNIGYPRLTLICDFLEKKLSDYTELLNWNDIDKYLQEIINIFEQIARENNTYIIQ